MGDLELLYQGGTYYFTVGWGGWAMNVNDAMNWNFLIAIFFLFYLYVSANVVVGLLVFAFIFYHEMLGSLHHTSMDTSVLWLLVVSPLLFPFLNLVFQKVFFLQRSLLEMKLNEIYSFFFFEQLYVIFHIQMF